ncbi:hypothetical protein RI367_006787 [Sorochytrium milnesiophthora]
MHAFPPQPHLNVSSKRNAIVVGPTFSSISSLPASSCSTAHYPGSTAELSLGALADIRQQSFQPQLLPLNNGCVETASILSSCSSLPDSTDSDDALSLCSSLSISLSSESASIVFPAPAAPVTQLLYQQPRSPHSTPKHNISVDITEHSGYLMSLLASDLFRIDPAAATADHRRDSGLGISVTSPTVSCMSPQRPHRRPPTPANVNGHHAMTMKEEEEDDEDTTSAGSGLLSESTTAPPQPTMPCSFGPNTYQPPPLHWFTVGPPPQHQQQQPHHSTEDLQEFMYRSDSARSIASLVALPLPPPPAQQPPSSNNNGGGHRRRLFTNSSKAAADQSSIKRSARKKFEKIQSSLSSAFSLRARASRNAADDDDDDNNDDHTRTRTITPSQSSTPYTSLDRTLSKNISDVSLVSVISCSIDLNPQPQQQQQRHSLPASPSAHRSIVSPASPSIHRSNSAKLPLHLRPPSQVSSSSTTLQRLKSLLQHNGKRTSSSSTASSSAASTTTQRKWWHASSSTSSTQPRPLSATSATPASHSKQSLQSFKSRSQTTLKRCWSSSTSLSTPPTARAADPADAQTHAREMLYPQSTSSTLSPIPIMWQSARSSATSTPPGFDWQYYVQRGSRVDLAHTVSR